MTAAQEMPGYPRSGMRILALAARHGVVIVNRADLDVTITPALANPKEN